MDLDKAARSLGLPTAQDVYQEQVDRIKGQVQSEVGPLDMGALVHIGKFSRDPRRDWARMAPMFMRKGLELAALGMDPPSKWTAKIMEMALAQISLGKIVEPSDEDEANRLARKIYQELSDGKTTIASKRKKKRLDDMEVVDG